jgi:nitrite reductase/ring-hydroxylating ferredoxin subunit
MRQWVVGFWILAVGCLMSGCSGAEAEYSTWPCRFAFDRLNPTLATSLNAGSRGVFCLITEQVQKGRKYLLFQNNIGLTSEPEPETAEEVQAKFILGLNNGIIVGFQTLITEPYGGFVAYDVQCPNCVCNENNTINPNYRVTMDTKGIATCPKCKKTYDMNNGGIITNGGEGDTGLEKYVAITDGMHVSVFRR